MSTIDVFFEKAGYRFLKSALLDTALTHASVQKKSDNNERLEFLGDRVLGLVVAEMLYAAYPREDEGALAKRLTALVQKSALVKVAKKLALADMIRISTGEKRTGGSKKDTILADAVEALIGAIYLDGGLAPASAFIRTQWAVLLDMQDAPPEDPKTALQEWAQGRALGLPKYETIEHAGEAHAPVFTVAVHVDGFPSAQGTGQSKRKAEKAAALAMLEVVGA